MITKFKIFEEYGNEDEETVLRYHSFDIDDNLLHMDTTILMEHLVDGDWIDEYVDTDTFAKVRMDKSWRFKHGQESFVNFSDIGKNGNNTFINDFKKAIIDKKFGPSWNKFIECVVNGYIFSIITSRGHSPKNVRKAFDWLIYEYGLDRFKNLPIKNVDRTQSFDDQMIESLLKYRELFGDTDPGQVVDSYLDICPIYTVTSKEFVDEFGEKSVEESKNMALNDFNNVVNKYAKKLGAKAKYGFSDDDPRFVKAAIDQFIHLKDINKNIEYSVFDTGGRKIKKAL